MALQLANTPVSWGVHYPEDPRNEPWQAVLDGIAAAGYRSLELGALGYLPQDPVLIRAELERRGLTATAMYIFQPLTDPSGQEAILARARRTCELLAGVGGSRLVIIDERNSERIPTAGRSEVARRVDSDGFDRLMAGVTSVAKVAAEHGLIAVLHPTSPATSSSGMRSTVRWRRWTQTSSSSASTPVTAHMPGSTRHSCFTITPTAWPICT